MPAAAATLTQGRGCHWDTLAVPMPAPASFGQDPSSDSSHVASHPMAMVPAAPGDHVPTVWPLLGLGVTCPCRDLPAHLFPGMPPGTAVPLPAGPGDRDAERGASLSPEARSRGGIAGDTAIDLSPSRRSSSALSPLRVPSLYPPPSVISALGCGLGAASFGGCQMSLGSRGAGGHEGPPC